MLVMARMVLVDLSWIMIKACHFLGSSATSWEPLETKRVCVKLSCCSSYTGFQEFLTTLERDGHRFKPKAHVLNTGLPLTKHTTLAKWNFIAENCQKHLPAGMVFERRTCADPTFCWISRWFLGTRSFWYLTVRLVSTLARLPYPCFKDSDK